MFFVRRHVRNISSPLGPWRRHVLPSTRRGVSGRILETNQLQALFPVAEQLLATGTWKPGRGTSKAYGAGASKSSKRKADSATKQVKGDKSRVNIVSDALCDDVLSYLGSSLDRHRGCDIIDIYPGAGLWSRKLHDRLQPRSHILMEPDDKFYAPFLQPLLDRPGTTLVPKNGIVWKDLYSILDAEHLPHQVVADESSQMQRNDTLLVTANFSFHPKRRYRTFDSIAQLLLHQFIEAIRSSSIFQRYGQVRMLIWTRCDDKTSLIPRSIQKHKKGALAAELSCEWVHEVCGLDGPDSVWFTRENALNTSSAVAAIQRMRAAGMQIPAGRESESYQDALHLLESGQPIPVPGQELPTFHRPFQDTLAELEAANEKELFSKDSVERRVLKSYSWRANWELKKHSRLLEVHKGLDAIYELYRSPKAKRKEIRALEKDWVADLNNRAQGFIEEFATYKDNIHYFRQTPPVLLWDRRSYEPLAIRPEEFFPNTECSLLDIQPKPVHPLLRETGPGTNRAADTFDLLMTSMLCQATMTLPQALDGIYPGASDYIMPRLTSLNITEPGGFLSHLRYVQPTPRLLNTQQWEQLLELWIEWPFRPDFHELVARTTEDESEKHDENEL